MERLRVGLNDGEEPINMNRKITIPVLASLLAVGLMLGVLMVTYAAEDMKQITVCVNNAGVMRLNSRFGFVRFKNL